MLCAVLAAFGGLVLGGAFVALAAIVVIGNVMAARREQLHEGITTEIAILVMFAVGAVLQTGPRAVGVVVGGGVAVLLYAKPVLQSLHARFDDRDVRAMMQFALVTLVILPVLPDRAFGPFDVLNPREIWLMVVLVVGVSLGGYVAQRLLGSRPGAVLGGLLGGLISSTATTVGFARRSRGVVGADHVGLLVILLAGAVTFARVTGEVVVAGPGVFPRMVVPLVVLGVASATMCVAAWLKARHQTASIAKAENPAELKSALLFAAIYALVIFCAAAASHHFGPRSMYVVALISGATDMDAITLSSTRLAANGQLDVPTAWRAIVLASIANLAFKSCTVWILGSARLARQVTIAFAIQAAVGLAMVLVWRG
ncbi:MAG: DUF4010 domain-containing protein [Phycisphaerales bacterium]